jgi:hypothetical protein
MLSQTDMAEVVAAAVNTLVEEVPAVAHAAPVSAPRLPPSNEGYQK